MLYPVELRVLALFCPIICNVGYRLHDAHSALLLTRTRTGGEEYLNHRETRQATT